MSREMLKYFAEKFFLKTGLQKDKKEILYIKERLESVDGKSSGEDCFQRAAP